MSIESADAEIVYNCDTCGERFNTAGDANAHNQAAHREQGTSDDSDRGL
ncbi:MAG TPA: hypothetical protein VJP79_11390 [Nitrososphaera sp.]|nr:hypothetical protein [Nitrososphaera sp.]